MQIQLHTDTHRTENSGESYSISWSSRESIIVFSIALGIPQRQWERERVAASEGRVIIGSWLRTPARKTRCLSAYSFAALSAMTPFPVGFSLASVNTRFLYLSLCYPLREIERKYQIRSAFANRQGGATIQLHRNYFFFSLSLSSPVDYPWIYICYIPYIYTRPLRFFTWSSFRETFTWFVSLFFFLFLFYFPLIEIAVW